MNCPQCEQPIGFADYTLGEWKPVENDRGVTVSVERSIKLHCHHCGTFTARQDGRSNGVTNISGPVVDPAEAQSVESDIPGPSRQFVRVPA